MSSTEHPLNLPDSPEERRRKMVLWLPLWICSIFLLVGNLGVNPIAGSEARWLVITREMLQSGDWLHPTINGEPYFDKPLLTYWLIAIPSLINKSSVTELTARLPSVLAALAALGSLILIARRFLDTQTSVTAGWIFLTTFAFGWWGRLAEADMANLAFSTGAAAWFLHYADRKSLTGYIGFFALCCIGAHAKGMGAIAVPCLAVLADLIIHKRWTLHLNWKFAVGAAIGGSLYALPFVLAAKIAPAIPVSTQTTIAGDGTLMTSGIALALRENVIRFFAPFDHKDPFYSYLIHLPRHLLPWTPFFLLGLVEMWNRRKTLSKEIKWVLLTFALIFLFFTLSGSRRHYYILPILPYCMIITAIYLSEKSVFSWNEKIKQLLLRLYAWLPIIAVGLLLSTVTILKLKPSLIPDAYQSMLGPVISQTLFSSGVLLFMMVMFFWRSGKFGQFAGSDTPSLPVIRAVFSVLLLLLFLFIYVFPCYGMFRTESQAAKTIGGFLKTNRIPPENVYFLNRIFNNTVYYMNLPYRVKLMKKTEEVGALMNKTDRREIFVISQERYFKAIPAKDLERMPRLVRERALPWELKDKKALEKKLELRIMVLPRKKEIK